MGLHTATKLNHWVKSAEAKTLHAGRLNIGPRLILGFVFIILSMLAADAVILWQFHLVRTQAERLNDIDQKLVAVLRVHSSLLAFHDRLDALADSGDWRAVHLRLENQVRPLESLTSALVERVDHEAGEQQAQTVLNIRRVQRRGFLIVPLTAVFTLLIAGTLGLAITRSITQPLARLVEGSKALARGEFQHQVSVTGKDELA